MSSNVSKVDGAALFYWNPTGGPDGDGAFEKVQGADGTTNVADQSTPAIDNPTSALESFTRIRARWKKQIVTFGDGATAISSDGAQVIVASVRVNGSANLGGACSIAEGTIASKTEQEALPSGSTPGTELDYKLGTEFLAGCVITVAASGSVIVLYRDA